MAKSKVTRIRPSVTPAQTFSEFAETPLADVKSIICQIEQLGHDGQESTDPAMILSIIERLAGDAEDVMFGDFWDVLVAGLRRANGSTEVAHG